MSSLTPDVASDSSKIREQSAVETFLRLLQHVGPLEEIDALGLTVLQETLRELTDYLRARPAHTRLTLELGMEVERRALVRLGFADDKSTSLFLPTLWRWQLGPLREAIWNRTDDPANTRLGCLRAIARGLYARHGLSGDMGLESPRYDLRRKFGLDFTSSDFLAQVQGELYANRRSSFLVFDAQGHPRPDRRAIRDALGARKHLRHISRERDLDPSAIAHDSDTNFTPEFSEQAHEFRQGRALLDRLRNHAMECRDRALEAALDRLTGEDPISRSYRGVATKFGITVASVRAGHKRMIKLAKHFRSFG